MRNALLGSLRELDGKLPRQCMLLQTNETQRPRWVIDTGMLLGYTVRDALYWFEKDADFLPQQITEFKSLFG